MQFKMTIGVAFGHGLNLCRPLDRSASILQSPAAETFKIAAERFLSYEQPCKYSQLFGMKVKVPFRSKDSTRYSAS